MAEWQVVVHGSLGWGKWAGRTGERKEVAGVSLLLPHLKPFGRFKILFNF